MRASSVSSAPSLEYQGRRAQEGWGLFAKLSGYGGGLIEWARDAADVCARRGDLISGALDLWISGARAVLYGIRGVMACNNEGVDATGRMNQCRALCGFSKDF